MAVIEAKMPDGRVTELVEVNLTKSGLLLLITDHEGHQVLVHRYAWDGMVKAVAALFEQETQRAEEAIRNYSEDED